MSKPSYIPPKFLRRLYKKSLPPSERDFLNGDFDELYNDLYAEKGRAIAFLWYLSQIINSLLPIIGNSILWRLIMLKNYLKIALRNLRKNKGFSLINIAGLAIGLTCCILIFLYVHEEMSYDNFHKDKELIYRVAQDFKSKSFSISWPQTGPVVGYLLRKDFPQVEYVARFMRSRRTLVKHGNIISHEGRSYYIEPDIFDILTFTFLRGDPATALTRPHTLVISERIAFKYFGNEDPYGKTLSINSEEFEITGIIKNYPSNTHLKFDFLLSFKTMENKEDMNTDWGWTTFYTYLKFKKGVDIPAFEEQIRLIENKYTNNESDEYDNIYFLQVLEGIHLQSHLAGEIEPPGNPLYISIISIIGLIILLIACVNFMNLTTARFTNRANEVGLRKVIGAQRKQLIIQFLGESFITAIAACFSAFLISGICLPFFNGLSGKEFTTTDIFHPGVLITSFILVLFVGVAAGSYPAIFLSRLKPALIFNKSAAGTNRSLLRKILVVGQFTVSIFLLTGTLIVFRQLNFMKTTYLGFDKEQKIVIPMRDDVSGTVFRNRENLTDNNLYETYKNEFQKLIQVKGVTASSGVPGLNVSMWTTSLVGVENDHALAMAYLFIDCNFISEYKIELLTGRNFSKELSTDVRDAFLINESAVKAFGWSKPEEALDRQIQSGRGNGKIIGVVKNFHFTGLQREIEPLIMSYVPAWFRYLTLTVDTENLGNTLSLIEAKWYDHFHNSPYTYRFLDEIFDRYYRSEEKTGKFFSTFTFLGIFISCLGLFGLASFTAERRTKEIGIRKVFGATVPGIIFLLSKDFTKWVVLANVIAWPAAYFIMNRWLQNFVYKINLNIHLFILSGISALFIALITVSFQAFKAARSNPSVSLKCE